MSQVVIFGVVRAIPVGKIICQSGNLFDSKAPIIAHGCNAAGGFASGVAGQVAHLFPNVKRAYHDKHKSDGLRLGDIQVVAVNNGPPTLQYIVNMITQEKYGRETGVTYVSYPAIELGMTTLLRFAEGAELSVAIPRIGAGLGGGKWDKILKIIRDVVSQYNVELEIWSS